MNFVEVLSSFVTFAVVGISMFAIRYLRTKISDKTWESMKFWINEAVLAAEQVYKLQPKSGVEKRTYALSLLDDMGINLDETEKNVLLEAAVTRLGAAGSID